MKRNQNADIEQKYDHAKRKKQELSSLARKRNVISVKINQMESEIKEETLSGQKSIEKKRAQIQKKISAANERRRTNALMLCKIVAKWTILAKSRAGKILNKGHAKIMITVKDSALKETTKEFDEMKKTEKCIMNALAEQQAKVKRKKEEAKKIAPLSKWKTFFAQNWMPDLPDEIDEKIILFNAQVKGMVTDETVMQRYNQLQTDKDELERKTNSYMKKHKKAAEELNAKKTQWVPRLNEIVKEINTSFKEYFRQIKCRGEVKLAKDESYDKFGLEIHVQFRKGEPLTLLCGTSQSGGERSVCTMLFLLCLQKVTNCPFRVVDEINQGMDPKNERMIFDQIVSSAESGDTPQYFLVTPKLLPNLKYSPSITILFIYSGVWALANHEWNIQSFIDAARKRKKRQPGISLLED